MKTNCWQFLSCGREPGGWNVRGSGPCPAATLTAADGFCGGKNGGRSCAFITGTYCSGTIQGTAKEKTKHCEECEFYRQLKTHILGLSRVWQRPLRGRFLGSRRSTTRAG